VRDGVVIETLCSHLR